MTIREIVSKLENIEIELSKKGIDPECEMVAELIDTIIADDLGWDAFGNYDGINGTKANTPTLDSLARNGITFTNYWVNPHCSPIVSF